MKTIKTYCYGTLKEFFSIQEAIRFYSEAVICSEGSERDRYCDVLVKLENREEPYCDCDGVCEAKEEPAGKIGSHDFTRAYQILEEKKAVAETLDSLRKELNDLKAEFDRINAPLIGDIKAAAKRFNDLNLELIGYEKLGFRA